MQENLTDHGSSNQTTVDDYWGFCPECGTNDGYLNVGRNHWFKCDKCKTKWCVGSNLFSSWQDQTEEEFEHNAELLAGYKTVEPVCHPSPVDDIPVEGLRQDRDSVVAELLADVDANLTTAWQELFWAMRKGVTVAEAAESLRLTPEFLGLLREHAMRRMGDAVWFKIRDKQAALAAFDEDIIELNHLLDALSVDDEEAIKTIIKGAY